LRGVLEPEHVSQAISIALRLLNDAVFIREAIQTENWAGLAAGLFDIMLMAMEILQKMGWEPEEAIEELKRRLGL